MRQAFSVFVTGHAIESVRFYVDGTLTSTVRARSGRRKFKLAIRPRAQSGRVHRVRALVTFAPSSRTPNATRRLTYRSVALAVRPPRFTG